MAGDSNQPQIAVAEAIGLLQTFRGTDLTRIIGRIEKSLKGVATDGYAAVLRTSGAKRDILKVQVWLSRLPRKSMWLFIRWEYFCASPTFFGLAK